MDISKSPAAGCPQAWGQDTGISTGALRAQPPTGSRHEGCGSAARCQTSALCCHGGRFLQLCTLLGARSETGPTFVAAFTQCKLSVSPETTLRAHLSYNNSNFLTIKQTHATRLASCQDACFAETLQRPPRRLLLVAQPIFAACIAYNLYLPSTPQMAKARRGEPKCERAPAAWPRRCRAPRLGSGVPHKAAPQRAGDGRRVRSPRRRWVTRPSQSSCPLQHHREEFLP